MQFRAIRLAATLAIAHFASTAFGAVQIVYSNNPTPPGDSFSNNVTGTESFQPIGSTGWLYSNVRVGSTIGDNTANPQSGNGSVYMQGTIGPSAPGSLSTSKADIEYISATSLGKFSQLTSMSYDWYRDAVSTNSAIQHPSLRVQWKNPNTNATGYLVFERAYNTDNTNTPLTVPTNTWVTDDVYGSDYKVWSNNGLALPGAGGMYDFKLSDWMSAYGNYDIIGFSSGFGSGWGPFVGAVDNITFGFNGNNTTYNFEVGAVPEPTSFLAWGILGVCGLAFAHHTAKKRAQAA